MYILGVRIHFIGKLKLKLILKYFNEKEDLIYCIVICVVEKVLRNARDT